VMKKVSKNANRNRGSKSFREFVEWCVSVKGCCGESDMRAFVCDAYKREYVIRYGATDAARMARRRARDPESSAGVKFMAGIHISDKEIESLYARGVSRIFNDLKTCGRRGHGGVSFCSVTKQFSLIAAKECHADRHATL
jgi:hypothetical protein